MKVKNPKTKKVVDVRLPKAFKTAWLKALRSGKFKQGKGYLESGIGYCCLGVACRVAHPKIDLKYLGFIDAGNFDKLSKIKVPAILKGNHDKGKDHNPVVAKLSNMNDTGKSFKVIASWIEKNL